VFNISDEQVIGFVTAWYVVVFVFGWFFYNGLRIGLIAYLAPTEARENIQKIQGEKRANSNNGGACSMCLMVLGWIWWLVTLPLVLIAKCVRFCAEFSQSKLAFCCNCTGLLYLLDYSWRTFLFIPRDSVQMGMDVLATIKLLSHAPLEVSSILFNF
jgi:hypothetical protein